VKKICFLLVLILLLLAPSFSASPEPPEIEVETVIEATQLEKFTVTNAVIKAPEIERAPASNAGELLENQLGVITDGVANTKAQDGIHIRGFDMSYIRVYFNGIPLNTPNDRMVDFSLIPLDFIRGVEVIRGLAPVVYGTDASGGIINFLPRQGKDSPGTRAKIQAGSFGNCNYYLNQGFSGKTGDFFLSWGKSRSSGYTSHTAYDLDYLLANADWNPAPHLKATFLFSRNAGDKQCPNQVDGGGNIVKRPGGFWPGSYNWSYQNLVQENYSVKLNWDNPVGLGWSLLLFSHVDDNVLTGWVDAGTPLIPPGGSPNQYYRAGVTNYSYWESQSNGGNLDFNFARKQHAVKFGFSNERDRFRQNTNGSLSRPLNEWNANYWSPYNFMNYGGCYLQDEIKLNPALTLTLGGRDDTSSYSGSIGNYNLNLVRQKADRAWRFCLGTTSRFPTLKELQGKFGNPNLVPERAFSIELGYRQGADDHKLEASLFSNSVRDLIGITAINSPYQNWAGVKIYGFEASTLQPLGTGCLLSLGVQYQKKDFGSQPPVWGDLPPGKFSLELYSRPVNGNINWNLESFWLSSRKTGDPLTPVLASFILTNLKLSYQMGAEPRSSQTISLLGRNLFNIQYQEMPGYPEPGRGVWGELSLKF